MAKILRRLVFDFAYLVRATGTYLYGRRMYETMIVWDTDPNLAAQSHPQYPEGA